MSDSFEDIDAQLFQELHKTYKNIKLVFDINNDEYLLRAEQYELPHFFSNFVTSIDELMGFLSYHPTDMYICEELCFSLDKVSKILHDNNVKVRVFPNICQSSWAETPSIKTFFIRPNDISIYSVFVDVFELISDRDRQKVLFKIYKEEKWFGKIKEVIPSFKSDLDNKYIINSFGIIRSKCGKRCFYKPGSCNICDRLIDVADTFKENKIVIRKAKKKD